MLNNKIITVSPASGQDGKAKLAIGGVSVIFIAVETDFPPANGLMLVK